MSAPLAASLSTVPVFLSYSHRDEAWKEDLKSALASLASNGYISIWDDRRIPAGTEWEPDLEEHLNDARITLLLVSEHYVNSQYCRRERDAAIALHRQDPDNRRVMPLFIKRVTLTERDPLLALQGLPRDMKWADDWPSSEQNKPCSLIADGILEEVYALLGHSARRPAGALPPPMPRLHPRFVDRDTQEREFKDFWDVASWSRPKAAQIYMLPAMQLDRPDCFVDRLREDTVERLARSFKGAHKAAIDRVIVSSEPRYQSLESLKKDLARDLFEQFDALALWNPSQLSAKPLATLDRLRLFAFILIEQTISTDRASPFLSELLSWYFDSFWADFRADPQVLVFVHLASPGSPVPRRSRWLQLLSSKLKAPPAYCNELDEHLRRVVPDGRANLLPDATGAPVKVLSQLAPIQLDDIRNWLARLGVPPHEIDPTARRLFRQVMDQFGDTRLSYIYRPLDDFYAKHLGAQSSDRRQPTRTL